MGRLPRLHIPALIGLTVVLCLMMAGLAQAFPASTPDNTGMVDFPSAGPGSNAVAVRTIAQSGSNVWVGGRFTEIDDVNGNFVQAAANIAAFDSVSGLVAPGVHIPTVTSSVGDPEIYDSSVGPDGNLYFAGNFDSVDGQTRHNVAAINATTGALTPFTPSAASANSVLATASAIYVGTAKLLSFQLNGAPTPGYTAPTAIIDAKIRAHATLPQFRDIQLQGNTLVAACQCDSLSDANGTRTVKAVVEIDAASGNWVNWRPAGLDDSSAAFGITTLVHALPGTGAPTVYLAAGGSDFTAAYDFSSGIQVFKTDTSGSSQAITWYQGTLVIGGHFDWSNSPTGNNQCGDNASPNTACYHTPKLVSMNASTGAVLLNGGSPWNPGICCKYNGVWALLTGNDGSTLHVGGEFTQVGGTWSSSGTNWTLSNFSRQKFYARLSGPTSNLIPLTVQKTSQQAATGTVTSNPSGINCDVNCTSSGPTDFSRNATVTLTAASSAGFTFTGWSSADSGFNCPGTGDCTVTMDTARTVVANFAGISYQLNVSKTGLGTGTVSSNPAGINCGTTCSSFFGQGTVVTMSATAGTNSAFSGWSGACTGTGSCVVTMNAAGSVTANFDRTTHLLTVQKIGAGTGTVTSVPSGITCGATCGPKSFSSSTVTLTAAPGGGNALAGWTSSDPGFSCPGTGPCTVTMDRDRTVTADFEVAKTITVTAPFSGTGSGTVSSSPTGIGCPGTCTAPFVSGSTVSLTAAPDPSSVLTGWSSNCTPTGPLTCAISASGTVTQRTVTVTFGAAQTLTVTPAGSGGGSITSNPAGIDCGLVCATNFATGTSVGLTATPDVNSTFAGWSGDCSGTGSCVVSLSQARNVTATFTLVQRALTVHVVGQGSMTDTPGPISCVGPAPDTGTCNATYQHGTDVQLVANPLANWSFTGWSGDCTGTDICVVSMTTARDVTATFSRVNRTVTVSKAGSGIGLVTSDVAGINCGTDCAAGYNQGDAVVLSATADPGSIFTGWSDDCTGTGTCNLTIDAAKNVTATFELLQTLTVTLDGAGTGNVTSDVGGINCPSGSCVSDGRTHNTHVILTATADPGSAFAGWSDLGCPGTTPTCDVTMDADKTVTATFQPPETLTVSLDGSGSGTVTSPPNDEINCPSTCTYDFPENGSVTLHAVASGTDVFVGWSSGDSGFTCTGTGDCQLTMDIARSVSAVFQPTHALSITLAGTPGGTVTSTPAGIDCGAICTASFVHGTDVLLHADGGTSAAFSGWSGDVVSCARTADCTVTMDQARSVTATFSPVPEQLTVTKTGGTGTGTVTSLAPNTGISCGVTCQFNFPQGTSVTLHAAPDASSSFVGWSDAGCPGAGDCTLTMNVAKSVNATFIHGVTLGNNDPAVAYNGWFGVADAAANGGSYRMSSVKNDKAVWKSPVTTSVTWVTRTGPDQGMASVLIDGVNKGTVDLYAAAPAILNQTYSGLSSAVHTVLIKVLHTKNVSSSNYNVRLDAFVVGATTTQESDPKITYDTWKSTAQALATDGTYRSATAATATATVTFTGTSIDWTTTKGKAYGKASVTIDGVAQGPVDLYQAITAWKFAITYGGLTSGPHTMVIQVLGQKNALATSTKVVVDGFVVH